MRPSNVVVLENAQRVEAFYDQLTSVDDDELVSFLFSSHLHYY